METKLETVPKAASSKRADALSDLATQELIRRALHTAARTGMVGLGAGMAGRGMMGLAQTLRRHSQRRQQSPAAPVVITMPKLAGDGLLGWLKDFGRGGQATTVAGIPWSQPAALLAGAGGLYGGWKVMDKLLDARRRGALQGDLDEARREYESALAPADKTAADNELARELDGLYDDLQEKQANWKNDAGVLTGTYLSGATLAAALTAMLAYDAGKKKQRRTILDAAQAKRRQARFATAPEPIFVQPAAPRLPSPAAQRPSALRTVPSFSSTPSEESLDREAV